MTAYRTHNVFLYATELSTELEKAKKRIVKLDSVKTISFCQHKELMDDFKQRRAEKISVWKETFQENVDDSIIDVKVSKADSVKLSVEENLIVVRLKEHLRVLETLLNGNMERKATLADAMAKLWSFLESGRYIDALDYSVKIWKPAREVQRLSGLAESKNLESQTMLGFVKENIRSNGDLSKLLEDKNYLGVESKIVLALGTEIPGFNTATGSIIGSLQKVEAPSLCL